MELRRHSGVQVLREHVASVLSNKNVRGLILDHPSSNNRYRKASPRLYRCAFGKRMAAAEVCFRLPWRPRGWRLLPGLTNTMADAFSKRAQPMSSVTLATFLTEATPVFLLVREAAHFSTTTDPVMPARNLKFPMHHRNPHM